MNATQRTQRGPALQLMLALMLIAGLVRIATTLSGEFSSEHPTHSGQADAVIFRRSAQLVAVSIGVLIARHGLETPSDEAAIAKAASGSYVR